MSKSESPNFCTSTNFKSAAVYLSQELQNLGLKYKIIEANGEKINLVSLVNNCWELIQLYHSSLKEKRNLHEERHKDMADLSYLQTAVKELRGNVKDNERLMLEAQERERQLNIVNKAFTSKLKVEKDEVKKLSIVLQQKDIQHQHESKKFEICNTKLKDRISRLISNDRSNAIPNMRMSTSLDKNQGIRGRWKTEQNNQAHEAELYQKVFSRYEAWINQLVDEAETLKEFLADVGQKLANLSNKCATTHLDSFIHDKDLLNSSATSSVFHPEATENAVFAVNLAKGREQIRKNFDDHFQVIERALQFNVAANKGGENVGNYTMDVEAEFLAEGLCVEEKALLLEEHKKLQEQRRVLEQEREKFANAAIRLNREKAEFEIEKVELLKLQFLSELPPQVRTNESKVEEPDVKAGQENQYWSDLLDETPSKHYVMPCITSPKGNIRLTDTASFLGPSTFRQPLKSKQRLSRTCVCTPTEGASAPSTRPPSLSRNVDSANFERKYRTLEIRERNSSLAKSSRAEDPLSFTFPRISAQEFSSAEGASSGRTKSLLRNVPSHESYSEIRDDLHSVDSGFGQDRDEADAQVGKRLTVLENSLVSLLNKIEAKRDIGKCPTETRDSSSSSNSETDCKHTRKARLSVPIGKKPITISPNTTIKRRMARSRPSLPSKLISAPSSLFNSRKSSMDNR